MRYEFPYGPPSGHCHIPYCVEVLQARWVSSRGHGVCACVRARVRVGAPPSALSPPVCVRALSDARCWPPRNAVSLFAHS